MNDDYWCGYHNGEEAKKFIGENGSDCCELSCPLNPEKICYRWDICYMGKQVIKENNCKECSNYNIGDGINDIRKCSGCKQN